ncbi:MAG: glycosyltransferase family 4 protein [Candidatus Krumholzibacteria bacterium]
MLDAHDDVRHFRGIAFIGTYIPRACGIATFTHDLAEATARLSGPEQPVIVTAMNERPQGYPYPDRVKFEIRQDYQVDYSRAADFLNFSRLDVISLQHEYGIFGGEWGANVLTLLRDLHPPLVVTCHSVPKEPDPLQKEVFSEIAAMAKRIVVMSAKAFELLESVYGVHRDKVVHISHGIHDVPFVDPNFYKDKFGVEGRRVILTFGLLHREKGLEYMLEALPAIVERHPDVVYVILGATHPTIEAEEGESYRLSLQRRVRELGIENHVLFYSQFVSLKELLEYLGASDIVVTPYLNIDRITSGVLAYAIGSGKAVVSTPYWHAQELLADGRGCLVPTRDSRLLAQRIIQLLDDERELSAIRKRAYEYSRHMTWPNVAKSYLALFDEVRSHVATKWPAASETRRPITATNLPLPKLDHLVRLSDDTGPSHHARFTLPDWSFGYHLEDAAAALVASCEYHNILGATEAVRLSGTFLALLQNLIRNGRDVAQALDYTRHRKGRASEVALGKAVWALGHGVNRGPSVLAAAANDLFHRLLPHAHFTSQWGAAYAVLGAVHYLTRFPGATEVRRYLAENAGEVEQACRQADWIERWRAPDWPVAAQALTMAASSLGQDGMRVLSSELIANIRTATVEGTVFLRRGDNPEEEELPTTASAFITALDAAYQTGRDNELLRPIRSAADWFLGANRMEETMYDFSTGGCHDGLTASGANRNQGTAATVHCLLAFLTLHRLAGSDATSVSNGSNGVEHEHPEFSEQH